MSLFGVNSNDIVDREAVDALKKAKSAEDAKKVLKDLGIEDPSELTPEQRRAAERTRANRKNRALPTFDDVVRDAMLSATRDFDAFTRFKERAVRLKDERSYDPMVMKQSNTAAMIRRQRHNTMLEQGRSITAAYVQASAFWVGSTTTALVSVLTILVGFQVHKIAWAFVPWTAFFSWRSWEAYESVSEDLRFQYQAQEVRAAKRAHLPQSDVLMDMLDGAKEKTPLERKREKRRLQEQQAELALARRREELERQRAAEAAEAPKAEPKAAAAADGSGTTAATPDMLQLNKPSGRVRHGDDDDEDDMDTSGSRPMDKYLKAKDAAQEERLKSAAERARKLAS